MPNTVKINLSILSDTDRMLSEIATSTFLRSKGNVVDLAVSELWNKLHPGEEALQVIRVSGEALQKEP